MQNEIADEGAAYRRRAVYRMGVAGTVGQRGMED